MKGFTLLGILILVLSASFVQGQDVCPHTGGWEKSGENEQHVTIIIEGDTITFIPDTGWKIFEICLKAGTNVYYQSFEGGTSDIVIINSPSGQDVSHGAALMIQPEPTSTFTPTVTIEVTNTPTLNPTETPQITPTLWTETPQIPTNTPQFTSTPWNGTPTPWPTKECQIEHCGGTG